MDFNKIFNKIVVDNFKKSIDGVKTPFTEEVIKPLNGVIEKTKEKLEDKLNEFPGTKDKINFIKDKIKNSEIGKMGEKIKKNIIPVNYFGLLSITVRHDIKNSFTMYIDGRSDANDITYKEYKEAFEIIEAAMVLITVQEWNKLVKSRTENKDYIFIMSNKEISIDNKKELTTKSKKQNVLVSNWVTYKRYKTLNGLITKRVKSSIETMFS